MREPTEREIIQKDVVLKECFECLVKTGIEGASINSISNATGMAPSSLYYWFRDKDEIMLDSTEYGLRNVVEKLFDCVDKNIDNPEQLCDVFIEVIKKYSASLRFVVQIAASPKYGEQMLEISSQLLGLYDGYACKLSKKLEIPQDKMKIIVDMVVALIIDAVVWNDWDKLFNDLNYIFNELM